MHWISTYDSFSIFNLNIFNTDHAVLTNSKKTWLTSFHPHINIAWLCNLRFDYSKAFGGFAWLHVVLPAPPMASQGDLQ